MNRGKIFTKPNTSKFADSLIKEASALALLRQQISESEISELSIPEVLSVNEHELVLERVHYCAPEQQHQHMFARGLAALHGIKQENFGFHENNYIGLNPQTNSLTENWGDFFIKQRLYYQVGLIRDSAIQKGFQIILENVQQNLQDYLNQYCDFASLVHGDLWSGNVLYSRNEGQVKVWLIDPAVYFGDREVDIAMTEMFGGFSEDFYKTYHSFLPLSEEYPNKRVIYNLYHYLNHYNLFGDSYLSACQSGFEFLKANYSA